MDLVYNTTDYDVTFDNLSDIYSSTAVLANSTTKGLPATLKIISVGSQLERILFEIYLA